MLLGRSHDEGPWVRDAKRLKLHTTCPVSHFNMSQVCANQTTSVGESTLTLLSHGGKKCKSYAVISHIILCLVFLCESPHPNAKVCECMIAPINTCMHTCARMFCLVKTRRSPRIKRTPLKEALHRRQNVAV